MPEIVFLPDHVSVKVSAGTSIQEAGRSAGLLLDAVCPAKLNHTSRCKSGHGNRQ